MRRAVFRLGTVVILLLSLAACSFGDVSGVVMEKLYAKRENEEIFYNALYDQNYEAVREVIGRGVDPNTVYVGPKKENALYYYSLEHMGVDAYYNHTGVEIAEFLLENGADPNAELGNGVTLLMYCCGAKPVIGAGCDILFDLLIKSGADISKTDDDGYTVLDYVVLGDLDLVQKLLDRGAKISEHTFDLALGISQDYSNIVEDDSYIISRCFIAKEILIRSSQQNFGDKSELIQLCRAAASGNSNEVISLLHDGAYSGESRTSRIAKQLIVAFCDIDTVKEFCTYDNSFAKEYFELAVAADNIEVAKYMQSICGVTDVDALYITIKQDQEDLTQYYLDKGALIGYTPSSPYNQPDLDWELYNITNYLIIPCQNGNIGMVDKLLAYGYPTNDYSIYCALQAAIFYDQPAVIAHLCEKLHFDVNYRASESADTLIEDAALHGNVACAEALLQQGADLSANPNCLSDAALKGELEMVKKLLEWGVSPDSYNWGDPALMQAISNGNYEMVKILIENGADVNIKKTYQMTTESGDQEEYIYPIHEAARSWSSNILQLLVDSGASTDLLDSDGRSPLDWAITSYNKDVLSSKAN